MRSLILTQTAQVAVNLIWLPFLPRCLSSGQYEEDIILINTLVLLSIRHINGCFMLVKIFLLSCEPKKQCIIKTSLILSAACPFTPAWLRQHKDNKKYTVNVLAIVQYSITAIIQWTMNV